jgi:hypothetical protein
MFMQPLGAFLEPNHPLHYENMPAGLAKNVAESWILTEDVLDRLYDHPERFALAASIAASISGEGKTKAQYSVKVNEQIDLAFTSKGWEAEHNLTSTKGAYTWTPQDTYLSSMDYLNPQSLLGSEYHQRLKQYAPRGVVTNKYLHELSQLDCSSVTTPHPWLQNATATGKANAKTLHKQLTSRLQEDPYASGVSDLADSIGSHRLHEQLTHHAKVINECSYHENHPDFTSASLGTVVSGVHYSLPENSVGIFETLPEVTPFQLIKNQVNKKDKRKWYLNPANWEFVIIRPNIEHYMLGIILGQSGDSLGNTLWGQTELSVYDDAQHGVWGMSYKYHERAIVFNEKNLIRLWDIAYDGYNGGKDDTFVDWTSHADIEQWKMDTNDITRDYHGKSMIVMAFPHRKENPHFTQKFKSNWPSPIVFFNKKGKKAVVYTGAENESAINTSEFEVFDTELYPFYQWYHHHLGVFADLFTTRKTAALSSQEDETQVDCLAFQGTMKVRSENGFQSDVINGSGHHGLDYVGVSSIRAGKGYKMIGGISNMIRQI